MRPRPGERLPRGGVRTAGWWLSATGLSGAARAPGADRAAPRHPGLLGPGGAVRRGRPGRGQRLPAPPLGGPVPRAGGRRGRPGVGGQVVRHEPGRDRPAHRAGRRRAPVRHRRRPGRGAGPARPRAPPPAPRPPGRLSVLGGALYGMVAGSTTGSSGGPSRSRRRSTIRRRPGWSAAAPGSGWPGRRSVARAGATWPPRCAPSRSRRSWANRRPPSPSGCSWAWRAPPPRPSGSLSPWPSWSAPGPSTGSC
jgi:hypothetical protein